MKQSMNIVTKRGKKVIKGDPRSIILKKDIKAHYDRLYKERSGDITLWGACRTIGAIVLVTPQRVYQILTRDFEITA